MVLRASDHLTPAKTSQLGWQSSSEIACSPTPLSLTVFVITHTGSAWILQNNDTIKHTHVKINEKEGQLWSPVGEHPKAHNQVYFQQSFILQLQTLYLIITDDEYAILFSLQYRLQPTEMTKLFCANDENGLGGFKLILNSECSQCVFFPWGFLRLRF